MKIIKIFLDVDAKINVNNINYYKTILITISIHDNNDNFETMKLLLDNNANSSLKINIKFRFFFKSFVDTITIKSLMR